MRRTGSGSGAALRDTRMSARSSPSHTNPEETSPVPAYDGGSAPESPLRPAWTLRGCGRRAAIARLHLQLTQNGCDEIDENPCAPGASLTDGVQQIEWRRIG